MGQSEGLKEGVALHVVLNADRQQDGPGCWAPLCLLPTLQRVTSSQRDTAGDSGTGFLLRVW